MLVTTNQMHTLTTHIINPSQHEVHLNTQKRRQQASQYNYKHNTAGCSGNNFPHGKVHSITNNPRKFKLALQIFLHKNSFYSLDEYFQFLKTKGE